MSKESVIIVGAGVAGLSLAILLAQRNIESQVLEARHYFDGPTSGVRISAGGVEILRSMGVDAIGEVSRRMNLRFGGLSASFSDPETAAYAVVVTRLALHEQLMKRAQDLGIRVMTGFNAVAVTEYYDRVKVISDFGAEATGALLVGADGVGSRLRKILNPDQGPTKTYAGYLGVGLITSDDTKVEMTLHHYPGHQVGIASCGRVNEAAATKSIFMWTHIRMSEADAKLATRASVEAELARRAERWKPELACKHKLYVGDPDSMLAFGPVYNGQPPDRWYSNRMILIGDAAHPYGPGGQGISMALKDARELSTVAAGGFTEHDKRAFQQFRARESRALGEAAEKRNAKAQASNNWGILAEGVAAKAMEIFTRGTLEF